MKKVLILLFISGVIFAVVGQFRVTPSDHTVPAFLYDMFGGMCIVGGFGLIGGIAALAFHASAK